MLHLKQSIRVARLRNGNMTLGNLSRTIDQMLLFQFEHLYAEVHFHRAAQ